MVHVPIPNPIGSVARPFLSVILMYFLFLTVKIMYFPDNGFPFPSISLATRLPGWSTFLVKLSLVSVGKTVIVFLNESEPITAFTVYSPGLKLITNVTIPLSLVVIV